MGIGPGGLEGLEFENEMREPRGGFAHGKDEW
jgi:hypothetical protein